MLTFIGYTCNVKYRNLLATCKANKKKQYWKKWVLRNISRYVSYYYKLGYIASSSLCTSMLQ